MSNENESSPKAGTTLADVATDEDKLFHDGYVKGIAEFIEKCATPMTIAIQGDWGSGKTSLIKLIEAELRAEGRPPEDDDSNAEEQFSEDDDSGAEEYCSDVIAVASVDVWQQFGANPAANLFETLLSEMMSKLSGTDLDTIRGVSGFAAAASQIVSAAVTAGVADEAAGGGEGSASESPFDFILTWLFGSDDKKSEKAEEGATTSAADLEAFRSTFVDALRQIAEEHGKSKDARFVVFVDGLDHIDPQAAVDLMEKIKTYLDCPQCVFVFSVDEKTVYDGVRKKLGDKVDEGRKKLFFDRFVQVPFRIPSSAYNLDKYVRGLMEGKEELSGELAAVIDILLKDPTLRCIKRCLNTMNLYQSVFGGTDSAQGDSLPMLLAAVILQVESPRGFDAVAECAAGDEENFDENLESALSSLDLNDGVNWAMLPALWHGGKTAVEDVANVDVAKRNAFLSWVRKLK